MNKKKVNPEKVINQLFKKVGELTSDCVVKDAYIEQLEEEIKFLSSKLPSNEPQEK